MILSHTDLLKRSAVWAGTPLISITIAPTDGNGRIAREFDLLGAEAVAMLQQESQVVIDASDLFTTATALYNALVDLAKVHAEEGSYITPLIVLAQPDGKVLTYGEAEEG